MRVLNYLLSLYGRWSAKRPWEARFTILGIVGGAIIGFMVGGIGVAMRGGAGGLWGWAVFAVIGGFLGNRFGVSCDRPLN